MRALHCRKCNNQWKCPENFNGQPVRCPHCKDEVLGLIDFQSGQATGDTRYEANRPGDGQQDFVQSISPAVAENKYAAQTGDSNPSPGQASPGQAPSANVGSYPYPSGPQNSDAATTGVPATTGIQGQVATPGQTQAFTGQPGESYGQGGHGQQGAAHQSPYSPKPVPGNAPDLPKGFSADQGPTHLNLETPGSFSHFGVVGLVALLVVLVGALVVPWILSAVMGPNIFSVILFYLVSPVAFFGVIYLLIASVLNRRVVEVNGENIVIGVKGPVPFPGSSKVIPTQSVRQVYVVSRSYMKTVNYGTDSIHELASTALAVHDVVQNGLFYHSYHVFALLDNGWRQELIGGNIGLKGAVFLEHSVERFLQIPNQPVESTWYQSLIYRETTLDEKSGNRSGERLRAKCLIMPLSYCIVASFMALSLAFVLVMIVGLVWANNVDKNIAARRGNNGKPGVYSANEKSNQSSGKNAVGDDSKASDSNNASSTSPKVAGHPNLRNDYFVNHFVAPDPNDPQALPIWGHKDGVQIGLAPTGGPQGLIRIYAPHLGNAHPRVINFVSIEPTVRGQSGRDQSELQESRDRPGERGLSFWASETVESGPRPVKIPAGIYDAKNRVLRVFIHTETFANGAKPIVECVFDAKQSRQVHFILHSAQDSAHMQWCTLSATMGNYSLLNRIGLRAGQFKTAQELWKNTQPEANGFMPWKEWGASFLNKTPYRMYYATLTSTFDDPANAEYEADVPPEWRYHGPRSKITWIAEPSANPIVAVNGRETFYGTDTRIPGGVSFENFEMRIRFRNRLKLWLEVSKDVRHDFRRSPTN